MTASRCRAAAATFLIAIGSADVAWAQDRPADPQCAALAASVRDACEKAIDIFSFVAPQLGTSVSAGNATLGQAGALGGLPRVALVVRATALPVQLPIAGALEVDGGGPSRSEIGTNRLIFSVPGADAAVGLLKGLRLGGARFGAVDLLASAIYVPSRSEGRLSLELPRSPVRWGYGARVGLLEESLFTPGLAATYLVRELPTAELVGTTSDDTLAVRGIDLRTQAWRLVTSKSFLAFDLIVGAGRDRYRSRADVQVFVRDGGMCAAGCAAPVVRFSQRVTRTNVFANVSFNLLVLRVAAEIGRVTGGSVALFNTFDGHRADDARLYAALGVRAGF